MPDRQIERTEKACQTNINGRTDRQTERTRYMLDRQIERTERMDTWKGHECMLDRLIERTAYIPNIQIHRNDRKYLLDRQIERTEQTKLTRATPGTYAMHNKMNR